MNYSPKHVNQYVQMDWMSRSLLLPTFRQLLLTYAPIEEGALALDYGCGTGDNIPYLQEAGYYVEGVDIEANMLTSVSARFPECSFAHISSGQIPRPENTYELALLSYILVEISIAEGIINILKDVYRTLKPGGILVIISSSDERHNPERCWAYTDVNFPENAHRTSGSPVRSRSLISGIEFNDYFWSDADCQHFISQAGFTLLEHLQPLAIQDEYGTWKDELVIPPSSLFIAQKP